MRVSNASSSSLQGLGIIVFLGFRCVSCRDDSDNLLAAKGMDHGENNRGVAHHSDRVPAILTGDGAIEDE
jgi:hypothetical protein